MAQFLRPDGNVTQSGFTGGFAEIDEASASDSDFAYGANNTAATLEVSLSNATDPVSSSNHVVRYRVAKTNNGTVDGGGNAVTVTAHLYQGTTLIASDTARTATGTWTAYSFTLTGTQADAITDYNDLRLRFTTTASGGGPSVRRGGAVSWAELEVPDAPPAAITTAQAGDSNVGSTWTGGVVPVAGESVVINHAVTVPAGTTFPTTGDLADLTVNANLTVNGTLNFSGNAVFA